MMAKMAIKIGDLFKVSLGDKKWRVFQFISKDATQLNSDVIRVFDKEYTGELPLDFDGIVSDDVDFYAHCFLKVGIKMGFWEKIGSSPKLGETSRILFRDTNDSGSKPGEQILISQNWFVWNINDNEFTHVGELKGKLKNSEIGIVINPQSIVHRIKTGEYDFFYPKFE